MARTQLFIQAARGIEEVEVLVLKQIDHLAFDKRDGQVWRKKLRDPVILGHCIRRFALHYRRSMLRYKRLSCVNDVATRRYQSCRKMYDDLTRTYIKVFHGTISPFDKDWELEKHSDAFGNDEELIEKFQQLKLAEAYHYNHQLKPEDDGIYISSFAEKKNKKHRTPADTFRIQLPRRGFLL
ncbi:hypothetical protein BU16DRAFT_122880 [Lophium mytilinum]|uniref:Uncharacterized protein n=1 Tax=Lophium mytilinum TaxID=390894 RepID=A0A6A6QHY6_9PEZI|nr:hypothetical protein BU16DRAFT_122880 [Lophium mytilinum]